MLEPLLNLMSPGRRARTLNAPLVAWGQARGLAFSAGKEGACSLAGEWGGRPVRIVLRQADDRRCEGGHQRLLARKAGGFIERNDRNRDSRHPHPVAAPPRWP